MKRPTATALVDCWAECQDVACGWRTEGSGTIGRAAQHHDATRHVVQFHQTLIGRYGSTDIDATVTPEQETLL